MSDWHWSWRQALTTPIAVIIMACRHERRSISKKGFGWAQLDQFDEWRRAKKNGN